MATETAPSLPPPIEVIALSVQVGAGGYSIARAVAEKLRFRYYDWEVTSRAIAEIGISLDSLHATSADMPLADRVMSRLALANLFEDEVPPAMIASSFQMTSATVGALSSTPSRLFIEDVVRDLAATGDAVIVGHGACVILKERPSILRVFIRASLVTRAKRMVEETGCSLTEASTALDQSDDLKGHYLHDAYGLDWLDPSNYDLVINTDRVTSGGAVEAIVAAARTRTPSLVEV
jgi:cytidylate kinase